MNFVVFYHHCVSLISFFYHPPIFEVKFPRGNRSKFFYRVFQRKTFNFAKGKTTLNFILRTDIKNELKDFKQCLEAALSEVENELNKL